VKTVIVAMLLATAIASPSNAGSGIKIEKPCWNKCSAPQPAPRPHPADFYANCCVVGSVRFVDHSKDNASSSSVSRSQMVIESNIGGMRSTSVIDSTYRSYSR
jgi:hypothetical protein